MTFVLLKPWNGEPDGAWWEWRRDRMRLVNFRGGGFNIDENADYWALAEIHEEFGSWHDLYVATGFNPLVEDIDAFDVWISPEGQYFDGNAHAVAAEGIVPLVYGVDIDDPCFIGNAETFLEEHHWIKATRSFMWQVYLEHRTDWTMTRKTYGALVNYCNNHKLKIPKRVTILHD